MEGKEGGRKRGKERQRESETKGGERKGEGESSTVVPCATQAIWFIAFRERYGDRSERR